MYEFKASAFHEATSRITRLVAWIRANGDDKGSAFHKDLRLDDDSRGFLAESLAPMKAHLGALGARVTSLTIDDFEEYIKTPGADWEGVKDDLDEVEKTLRRELKLATLLGLEPREQSYFEPTEPLFGAKFKINFLSNGAFELDEAAKCLALSRPTASVFHLMRLMEVGLRATAACLAIPDPIKPSERNWGKMLEKIRKDGIAARWPTVADRARGDGALFDELHASLDAVKSAWRDPTMHVEKKYTDSEAEDIFSAVRGFMRKLASRCDEDGEPKV